MGAGITGHRGRLAVHRAERDCFARQRPQEGPLERSAKGKLKVNLLCDAPQEERTRSTEREGKVRYYRHIHNGSSSGTTISQVCWRNQESEGRYMRHAAENHLHVKKVGKPTSLVR